VPWNPIGAILAPLALISLFYTRKKKGSKTGTFLVLLLLVGSAGMILAACGSEQDVDVSITQPQNSPTTTSVWSTPTATGTFSVTPPAPIDTLTPTCTPTRTPNLEPWKSDEGYDLNSNSILNWGAPAGDGEARRIRAHKVWDWMGSVPGWWNGYTSGYPQARDLAAWLLVGEGSGLLNIQTIEANPNGSWEQGVRVMVGLMGEHFNNGITDVELSTYTAFFNPEWDRVFDQDDWNWINRKPEDFYYYYVDKYLYSGVYMHTDAQQKSHRVDRWWDDTTDKQSGYCSSCIPVISVRIPIEGKTLFFGYDPE
jgi:hypothetical protein